MKRRLITNKSENTNQIVLNKLVHNMSKLIRNETLNGIEYFAVPSITITEGVWNGVLYTNEELAKFPDAWNGVPVTNGHPETDEGTPMQANTPEMLEKFQIGLVLNTVYTDKKLKSELWLNKQQLADKAPKVLENLENEVDTDVSTGLYTEDLVGAGEFNGITYNSKAVNYRPDHLAILTDETGACSWDDGAGMVRNKKNEESTFKLLFNKFAKKFGFKKNELSQEDTRCQIRTLLYDKYGREDIWIYICATFNDYVIFELDADNACSYHKISYQKDASDVVSLVGESVEVLLKTEYVHKNNNKQKETVMDRAEQVLALIANKANQWVDGDKEFLTGLEDAQFAKITAEVKPVENKEVPKEAPKENKEIETPKEVTVNSFLESAPAEIKAVLTSSLKMQADAKSAIVEKLVANEKVDFSKEQLDAKSLEELNILSKMVVVPVDYSGNGTNPTPKTNASDETPDMADLWED